MAFEPTGVRLEAQDASQFFGDMDRAEKAIHSFSDAAEKGGGRVSAAGEIMVGALRRVGEFAVNAFMEAGRAAVSFVKDSIGLAGDFESGMNRFGAAAGDSLEEAGLKVDDFKKLFLDIGKELPVSTSDVQEAAIELVKGGLDPLILKMGGLKDSIQFAAAAEMGLEEAATLAVKQLGVWTEATATAEEKTAFLAMSQDLLVKAAGASTLNVDNLAAAMNVAGGQASALGLEYEDFATGITLISPAFNSAQEAGTSFKNFLARIQPSTDPATAAMQELGLWTEETGSAFFNAQGQYVGNREAAELLREATAGLTEAKRTELLQTIFGNDAMGAAVQLAQSGAEGYDILAGKIDAASGVSATAAAKQQGFNTAMDNFKGSVEAAQIILGTHLLPTLTDLLNNYITPGVNLFSTFSDALLGAKDAAQDLSVPMLGALRIVQGIGDLFSGGTMDRLRGGIILAFGQETRAQIFEFIDTAQDVIDTVQGVIDTVTDVGGAFFTLIRGGSLGDTINAVHTLTDIFGTDLTGAILDVIAIVEEQLKKNFENAVNIVQTVIDVVSDVAGSFASGGEAAGALGDVLIDLVGMWAEVQETIRTVTQAILGIVVSVFEGVIAPFIETHGEEIKAFLAEAWDSITTIVTTALELVQGIVMGVFAVVKTIIDEHGEEIQQILSNAWTIISNVILGALEIIEGVLTAALKIFQGDWEGAWTAIREMSESVTLRIWEIIKAALDLIANFFGTSLRGIVETWRNNWNMLVQIVENIGRQMYSAGVAIVNNIWEGLKSKYEEVKRWWEDKMQALRDILPGSEPKDSSSPLRGLADAGAAFITNILDGMRDALPSLLGFVSDMGAKMVENIEDATRQISRLMADTFSGQADMFQLQESNLERLERMREDLSATDFAVLQTSLNRGLEESQQFSDPKQAAEYYDLQSRFAFKLADLRSELAETEDHDARERIFERIRLTEKAWAAENKAFQERARGAENPFAALLEDVQALISSITVTGDVPPALQALYDLIAQLGNFTSGAPAAPANGAQMAGTTNNYYGQVGSNWSMPVHTNMTPAALWQSYQMMQAMAAWGA